MGKRTYGVVRKKVTRMFHAQNGNCGYCGIEMFLRHEVPKKYWISNKHRTATFDHIVAKSKGGTIANDNGVCACQRCNTLKADLSVEKFFERYDELYYRLITKPQRVAEKRRISKAKNSYIIARFAMQVGRSVVELFDELVYNVTEECGEIS